MSSSVAAAAAAAGADAAAAAALDADTELPKAQVKRIVKSKLAELLFPGSGSGSGSASAGGGDQAERQQQRVTPYSPALNADALLAFREAARVFVCYVTAAANDVCREAKRSTVAAGDVLEALADLEFGDFVPTLRQALEAFKQETKEKNKKKAEQLKRRKERLSMSPPRDGGKTPHEEQDIEAEQNVKKPRAEQQQDSHDNPCVTDPAEENQAGRTEDAGEVGHRAGKTLHVKEIVPESPESDMEEQGLDDEKDCL